MVTTVPEIVDQTEKYGLPHMMCGHSAVTVQKVFNIYTVVFDG